MKKNFIYLSLFLVSLFCLVGTIAINIYNSNNLATTNQNNIVVDIIENNSNKMSLSKRYAQNESGDNVVEVTATVTPSNANANLSWNLMWADVCDEDVMQYLNLNVSSDTLTCQVTMLNYFDTQVNLICCSVEDTDIYATCTIDCMKRTTSIDLFELKFYRNDSLGHLIPIKDGDNNVIVFDDYAPLNLDIYKFGNLDLSYNRIGSIDNDYIENITLSLSQEIIEFFDNYIGFGDGALTSLSYDNDIKSLSLRALISLFFTGLPTNELSNDMLGCLASTSHWFDLTIEISDLGESGSINTLSSTYMLTGFYIEYTPNVQEINLNQENILL